MNFWWSILTSFHPTHVDMSLSEASQKKPNDFYPHSKSVNFCTKQYSFTADVGSELHLTNKFNTIFNFRNKFTIDA